MGWTSGWIGGSDSSTEKPKNTISQAPDRVARVKCWDSRDRFFTCLDKHNIIDSVKEDGKARDNCSGELQQFEKDCVTSWVQYFKQRRVAEFKKAELLKEQTATMYKT